MNTLISHGGGVPYGVEIGTTGTRVAKANDLRKYMAITNTSDEVVYLALRSSVDGSCPAEIGAGIYLAPEGGSFELNNVNMYYGEIWAIHGGSGTKRLSVQPGQ